MSGSFKSRKILPKLDGSVVPVREKQPLSPENCTISVCRGVTQTCFTRGRKRLKLCRNLQTACCRFCYSSPCGFLLTETCMLKSFFVLSPTQPFSVSRGMSIENSLNSGMWNHLCSFDQVHKLVVIFLPLYFHHPSQETSKAEIHNLQTTEIAAIIMMTFCFLVGASFWLCFLCFSLAICGIRKLTWTKC